MSEVWKQVPFALKYEASTLGRIRNMKTHKCLSFTTTDLGYSRLSLVISENKRVAKFVHQVIALTFLQNPSNKYSVNHINHTRSDNRLCNLEWATVLEQNQKKKNRKRGRNSTDRGVWKCDLNTGERLEKFDTVKSASINMTGSPGSTISLTLRGKHRQSYGFRWEYGNQDDIQGEKWTDLPPEYVDGATGYKISTYGRVDHSRTGKRAPWIFGERGYKKIYVKRKSLYSHRLVALCFIDAVPGKEMVNHIDGNKTNCHVSNLEWVTASENSKHALVFRGIEKKFKQYSLTGEFIKEHVSQIEAARTIGVTSIKKRSVSSQGYQWRVVGDKTQVDDVSQRPRCRGKLLTK